jgi:hypothetical protein
VFRVGGLLFGCMGWRKTALWFMTIYHEVFGWWGQVTSFLVGKCRCWMIGQGGRRFQYPTELIVVCTYPSRYVVKSHHFGVFILAISTNRPLQFIW